MGGKYLSRPRTGTLTTTSAVAAARLQLTNVAESAAATRAARAHAAA